MNPWQQQQPPPPPPPTTQPPHGYPHAAQPYAHMPYAFGPTVPARPPAGYVAYPGQQWPAPPHAAAAYAGAGAYAAPLPPRYVGHQGPGGTLQMPPVPVPVPPLPTGQSQQLVVPAQTTRPPAALPAPLVQTVASAAPSGQQASLPMNVFVGKLPLEVHDSFVEALLKQCGTVLKWKRTMDSETDRPKAFGFCTFGDADGALRAVKVLNDFPLVKAGEKRMLVKVGKKEQIILDALRSGSEPTARVFSRDEELALRARIQAFVDARDPRSPVVGSDSSVATPSPGLLQIGAPSSGASMLSSSSSVIAASPASSTLKTAAPSTTTTTTTTTTTGLLITDAALGVSSSGGRGAAPGREASLAGRDVGAEDHDRMIAAEMEKFRAKQAQRDRELEDARRKKLQAKIQETRTHEAESKTSPHGSTTRGNNNTRAAVDDAKPAAKRAKLASGGADAHAPAVSLLEAAPRPSALAVGGVKLGFGLKKAGNAARGKGALTTTTTGAHSTPSPFFGVESTAPRPLEKIDYGDDGDAGAKNGRESFDRREKISPEGDDDGKSGRREADADAEAARERERKVAERIPTERAALFALPVDWDAVERKRVVSTKLRPWVAKKFGEYLGEEEPAMIEFVARELDARAPPERLVDKLALVLEDDAEVLVVKLWRALHFHAQK